MTSSTAQSAFAHYLAKGVGRNAAAGIVGVLSFESALNPISANNSGTETGGVINPKGSYGLAQWNGPRQAALAEFASGKNMDVAALETQLDFVLTECANSFPSVWAAIEADMNVADFVSLFVRSYENPAKPEPEIAGALATAQSLLALPVTANIPPIPAQASPRDIGAPLAPVAPAGVIAPIDPEIAALEALYSILTPFPAIVRARMMVYLSARLS
jgi:hypothetical protein